MTLERRSSPLSLFDLAMVLYKSRDRSSEIDRKILATEWVFGIYAAIIMYIPYYSCFGQEYLLQDKMSEKGASDKDENPVYALSSIEFGSS